MRKFFVILAIALVGATLVAVLPSGEKGVPREGTEAPAFTLSNQEGKPTALAGFRGKWVVLYFYPKNFTPGCALEARAFQEDAAQYAALNAVVAGVSVDSPSSHKEFCAKEGLNFTLLADEDAKVSTLYGSVTNLGITKVSARNTFILDPAGVIRKVYEGVKPAGHSEAVLAELKLLQPPPAPDAEPQDTGK